MAQNQFARLTGDRKLDKKLRELDRKTGRKAIVAVSKQAMQPVLELAKQRAPIKTGLLRKSIRIGSYRARRGEFAAGAVVQTGTRKQLKIEADNPYYYPAALEYGSPNRGIRPRSFLRASLFLRRRQVLNSMRNQLRALLR